MTLALPALGQEMPFPASEGILTNRLPNDCAPADATPPATPQATPPATPQATSVTPQAVAPARASGVELKPVAVLACQQGKIEVRLTGEIWRNNPTAAKIPVTMELFAAHGVRVNVNSLDTVDNESGFALAAKPPYTIFSVDGGVKITWLLSVQSFNTDDAVLPLRMTFKYAVASAPDGTPLWLDAVTPVLDLMRHDTAPEGVVSGLVESNSSQAVVRTSWAYIPSLVAGLTLLASAAFWPLLRRINRLRPRQALPPAAAAWLELDELVRSGAELAAKNQASVFDQQHYKLIGRTLKSYLREAHPALESLAPDVSTWRSADVEAVLALDPQGAVIAQAIVGALKKLASVVYGGQPLPPAEHDELLSELRAIVPRPLTV
jgi:hypothetical protein